MRAQCLSGDRPEKKIECLDLARKMQQPSNLDEMGLKRLARFLGVRPRLVWLFKWQKNANSGVCSFGIGSIRHDELMESEFQ